MTIQTEPETNDYFPLKLELYQFGNGSFLLTKDFKFLSPTYGEFVIPNGFITDAYSIPFLATVFINRDNSDNRAAVIHDYLFKFPSSQGRHDKLKLGVVNDIMREAMELSPAPLPRWQRRAIMAGLKAGSWWPWIKARMRN